jgi:hypothetical protein
VNLLSPEPGDLILEPAQMGGWQPAVAHSIIWVSSLEELCIAEANHGNADGLKLGKRKSFEHALYYESLNKHVFRCKDNKIALKAADYAKKWAVGMDQPSHTTPKTSYRELMEKDGKAVLQTPYAMRERSTEKQQGWTTTKALFDAAKAWARAERGMSLSFNRGMGCAGFVTYCYQVASLESKFGEFIPADSEALLRDFVTIKNNANVMWLENRSKEEGVVARLRDPARKEAPAYAEVQGLKAKAFAGLDQSKLAPAVQTVPEEVMRDAASTRTNDLYQQLSTGKNFDLKGYLVGNQKRGESTKVGIIPKEWVDSLPKDKKRDQIIEDAAAKAFQDGQGW